LVRFEIRPREAGKHGGGDIEYAQSLDKEIVSRGAATTNRV
jgi:hypothetical protein